MVPYLSKSIEKKHNYYVSKENKKQTTNFNVFPHDAAELKKALGEFRQNNNNNDNNKNDDDDDADAMITQ